MQIKAYLKKNGLCVFTVAKAFLYWLLLGIALGAACGVIGAVFFRAIAFVTGLRTDNGWILYLLPVGALLSVLVYKACKVEGIGTNQVFEAARTERSVSLLLAPAVFIGSAITHLFGGSAGKEGAALQLGGSMASLFSRVLRLPDNTRHILTLCGMGGVFSAVFGTPLGAAVFAVEVVRVGYIPLAALFPVLVTSLTAYGVSSLLGTHAERFLVSTFPAVNLANILRVAVISIIAAVVSALFCHILHLSERLFKKYFKNPFIRIFVGGVTIVVLTLIVGRDYNGGGIEIIERVFAGGSVVPLAFLLKIIFTAVTVGSGFKGGEIVPTLFIGATLGAVLSAIVGVNTAFGAAIGMAALFCGVTNCPIATCFLSIELFGGGAIYFAVAAFISFILSGNISLYDAQRVAFSKLKEELLEQ